MTKETTYDAEISPLMAQIIDICKRNGIAFHAGFALDDDLECTTHVPPLTPVPDSDKPALEKWRKNYSRVADGARWASDKLFGKGKTQFSVRHNAPEQEK